MYCRQKGCTLEEVKNFLKWTDLFFEDEQQLKQFPVMAANIDSAKAMNEELQSTLKEYRDELDKKDKVIAEMTTELVIRKKLTAILS